MLFVFLFLSILLLLFARQLPPALALSHTLCETLTGSLRPFRLWSISHIPTTNSSLDSSPRPSWLTRSHICSSSLLGSLLRDHMSRTTMLITMSSRSSDLFLRLTSSACVTHSPLFAAHTPSYRFRSRSPTWSSRCFCVWDRIFGLWWWWWWCCRLSISSSDLRSGLIVRRIVVVPVPVPVRVLDVAVEVVDLAGLTFLAPLLL